MDFIFSCYLAYIWQLPNDFKIFLFNSSENTSFMSISKKCILVNTIAVCHESVIVIKMNDIRGREWDIPYKHSSKIGLTVNSDGISTIIANSFHYLWFIWHNSIWFKLNSWWQKEFMCKYSIIIITHTLALYC